MNLTDYLALIVIPGALIATFIGLFFYVRKHTCPKHKVFITCREGSEHCCYGGLQDKYVREVAEACKRQEQEKFEYDVAVTMEAISRLQPPIGGPMRSQVHVQSLDGRLFSEETLKRLQTEADKARIDLYHGDDD